MTEAELSRSASPAPASRIADAVAAFLLVGVALGIRVFRWPDVFTADGIRLVGPDAHYHLRRIQWSVENFPAVLSHDAYLRFPDGGEPIWTAAFDWCIAALAWATVGRGDPSGVEALAVWVPPLLGAATVAVVYATGRRFFGRSAGIGAGALLALLPAHIDYAQLGFVDHHVAMALLAALLLAGTLALVTRPSGPGAAIALGLAMGSALLVWPGALLHVALAQLCVLAWVGAAAMTEGDGNASGRAGLACVAHAIAFATVAPAAAGGQSATWGPLSPVVLSGFQPLWLGLPAIGLGSCALAWRSSTRASAPGRRGGALLFALGLPAAAALLFPAVRAGAGDALGWLFRDEAFQSVVAESLPLFSDGEGLSAQRAHAKLTPLVWTAPLALAALAARARRSPAHAVLALWCAALLAATLAQFRFANSFSVPWALATAVGLGIACEAVPARARRGVALAAVALALLVMAPPLTSQLRGAGAHRLAQRAALHDAARWLGQHSPPTAGWLEPRERPAYGVLTAWGDGHVTRYVAQRPVVQDNFGDDVGRDRFDQAESYFSAEREDTALAVARDLRARYVLVRGSGSGHAPEPYGGRSLLNRLYRLRGSAGALRAESVPGARSFAPGLTRHRLLYESPEAQDEEGGRYKLYEIVAGALAEGRAAPGEVVEAGLSLRADDGREFEYRVHTRAGPEGRYALRLPYPTTSFDGRFAATGPYRLRSGVGRALLPVQESAVAAGARIQGPDLVAPHAREGRRHAD